MNPFMITSNQSYGLQFDELKKATTDLFHNDLDEESDDNEQEDDSVTNESKIDFLYTRESDRIGEGVPCSQHPAVAQLPRALVPTTKRKKKKTTCDNHESASNGQSQSNIRTQDQVKKILNSYHHNPKEESPLYSTTANMIGMKKPSVATYTVERHPRSQQFSKSYNQIMFRDHGLNY